MNTDMSFLICLFNGHFRLFISASFFKNIFTNILNDFFNRFYLKNNPIFTVLKICVPNVPFHYRNFKSDIKKGISGV